jgi:NAD(P)-dependent dehydrogenase (short-subunit alcohol dehydrogenase family)
MREFKDKVAVVTGAASGIGRAMAERLAAEGMKVVLADIEQGALAETESEMKAKGATVLAVPTDVSKAGDVEALAEKAIDAFGAVHVLCNNAGVGPPGGPLWERTLRDWQWVLGVNLWGLIHGIRVFVPIMRAQDTECHIVNTSSMAGLASVPWLGIYNVTKHAIVTLSETLYHELTLTGTKLKVSVLCPAWVNTRLMDSDRNRPAELLNPTPETMSPQTEMIERAIREFLATGLASEQVADHVFNAIRDEKFYILTHPEMKDGIRTRMEDILEERNPTQPVL